MKKTFLLLIIILIGFSGCSLLKLSEDLEKLNKLVTLKGNVILEIDNNASVMIAMIKEDENSFFKTVEYIHKESAGKFTFTQEIGKYHIYAWADVNNNSMHETNEAISSCIVELKLDNSPQICNITIKNRAQKQELQTINQIKKILIDDIVNTHNLGTITNLESSNFSEDNASKGLWEPYYFTEEIPSGLFLLKKYNPKKKVVLFVHGINGTPQNFKHIIKALDTTNSQVMLFYYPSGLRLSEIANYLNYLMQEFKIKHQVKEVNIIAHSMGGLISREYINIQKAHNESIVNSFISISTPWSGHKGAKLGLEYAPDIIPVWNDMVPESLFLQNLFKIELDKELNHYLLFGFKGKNLMINENSDGVVTIHSQLRTEAQDGAYLTKGFNEEHMSILSNKELIRSINNILNSKK